TTDISTPLTVGSVRCEYQTADILHTVAVFRFAHPHVYLRFAGGRSRMSREGQLEALRVGINAGIVGDLLTTIGSTIAQDRQLCSEAGYEF
ncbi:MAG: hypothetical protein K2L28_02940, partial [Muribaculaceae bacterium]|nr:hypothetical protein [Muribaculaceae bacterium]